MTDLQQAVRARADQCGGASALARVSGVARSSIQAILNQGKVCTPQLCEDLGIPRSLGRHHPRHTPRGLPGGHAPQPAAAERLAVRERAEAIRAADAPPSPPPSRDEWREMIRQAKRRERGIASWAGRLAAGI